MALKNFALLTIVCLQAFSTAAFAENKSGRISVKESKGFGPPDGAAVIEFGKTVKLKAQPYIMQFFGSNVLTASAEVENTRSTPMFCGFFIAFFDKDDHLLGCSGQETFGDKGLKPGEKTQFGSLLIHMPPADLAKVASYQALRI